MLPTNDTRKPKLLRSIARSFAFVLLAILLRHNMPAFVFWAMILFFGIGGLLFIIELANRNLAITKLSRNEKSHKETSVLTITQNGFQIADSEKLLNYIWNDIETIIAYKLDLLTTDEVCMHILTKDSNHFRITEEHAMWQQFQEALKQNLPGMLPDWEGKVILPAFKTNLTLIFDRIGRSLREIEPLFFSR